MHDWFAKLNMESYNVMQAGDFNLNYDNILIPTKVYSSLRTHLGEPRRSKMELDELIWGD